MSIDRSQASNLIAELIQIADRSAVSASAIVARHALEQTLALTSGRSGSTEAVQIAVDALARAGAIESDELTTIQYRLSVLLGGRSGLASLPRPINSRHVALPQNGPVAQSGPSYDWRVELAEQLQQAAVADPGSLSTASALAGDRTRSFDFMPRVEPAAATYLYGQQPFDSLTHCGPGLSDEDGG